MFLDSVKSSQTRRKYKNALNEFLKLVPSKIYQEELNTIPQDENPKTLAKFFVDLQKKSRSCNSNLDSVCKTRS